MKAIDASDSKQGLIERGLRFDRNLNIAVGAAALVGAYFTAGTYPVVAGALELVAGFNILTAGAEEAGRRHFMRRRLGRDALAQV